MENIYIYIYIYTFLGKVPGFKVASVSQRAECVHARVTTASQINEKQRFCKKEGKGHRERMWSLFLAPWVEHGVFGGPEAQQVPHLIAKLGQVLAQVVEVFHGGLVRALHLLARRG